MFAKTKQISDVFLRDSLYRPVMRYAFGVTIIMAFAILRGSQIAYLIPFLALNFFAPGTKRPTLKGSVVFILMVTGSMYAGFLFVKFFYDNMLVYIPLLALFLFFIFYTDKLGFVTKLFILIALLAMPVRPDTMTTVQWAYTIGMVMTGGSIITILVVWVVYALFPDIEVEDAPKPAEKPKPDSKTRVTAAVNTFIVTFPVVLFFVIFRINSGLLVLIYVVVFSMMPGVVHKAGAVNIIGNLAGGFVTIIFYQLIVIVPNLLFFLLLLLGTALAFGNYIFSGKPVGAFLKTGFSVLVMIIGESVLGTSSAGSSVTERVLLIMTAILYVILAYSVLNAVKDRRANKLLKGSKKT